MSRRVRRDSCTSLCRLWLLIRACEKKPRLKILHVQDFPIQKAGYYKSGPVAEQTHCRYPTCRNHTFGLVYGFLLRTRNLMLMIEILHHFTYIKIYYTTRTPTFFACEAKQGHAGFRWSSLACICTCYSLRKVFLSKPTIDYLNDQFCRFLEYNLI